MFLLVRETEDDFWPLNLDSLDDKSVPVSFRSREYHNSVGLYLALRVVLS